MWALRAGGAGGEIILKSLVLQLLISRLSLLLPLPPGASRSFPELPLPIKAFDLNLAAFHLTPLFDSPESLPLVKQLSPLVA